MAESGHWYEPNTGKLVTGVPYKDKKRAGELRPPTLRDARELGLLPSVTTILSLLARPGLETWKIQQAVRTALLHPKSFLENDGEYVKSITEAAGEKAMEAADFGTEIHYSISLFLNGQPELYEPTEVQRGLVASAFRLWYPTSGLECERSEHSFISPYGWAGTADFLGTYCGKPSIVDFKTQEFENIKDVHYYDEHPLQLAGYGIGTGQEHRQRVSVVISRNVPGLVALKIWDEPAKWDLRFMALWELWKLMKDYRPGETEWQPKQQKQPVTVEKMNEMMESFQTLVQPPSTEQLPKPWQVPLSRS